LIDGAKEATDIMPERLGIVGIVVLGRRASEIRGQQAAVLAEGTKEDPVQELLR